MNEENKLHYRLVKIEHLVEDLYPLWVLVITAHTRCIRGIRVRGRDGHRRTTVVGGAHIKADIGPRRQIIQITPQRLAGDGANL